MISIPKAFRLVSGVNKTPDPFWRAGDGAWHDSGMSKRSSSSKPWRVAGVSFVQVRIEQPHQRQMRIEFENQISLVLTHADQIPLAARLIEFLRAGKEASR